MVRNENVQREGNSLLKTATSKRVGPGRFANLVLRATQKPPLKKVKVPSDASRVSELTGSIIEDVRPVIKEIDNFDVESSVLGMSLVSAGPDGSSEDIGKDTPVAGKAVRSNPQPAPFRLPIRKLKGPMPKKNMEIQPGIRFTAPSPMSLDRIEVQMGQEHTAPESEDYKKQVKDAREDEEIAQRKREKKQAKLEKAKEIKEKFRRDEGEGFEAQLDDFEQDSPRKKKSIIQSLIGQIRLNSPKRESQNRAMSPRRARAMAREALKKSGKFRSGGMQPQGILGKDIPIPVEEITTVKKEDSISDLDSSQKRAFPVREIVQARDDESVSTLGLAHVLERIKPVVIATEMGPMVRDPAGQTPALLDKIDSGTMTENAEAATHGFRCGGNARSPKALGFALGALCMHPSSHREDAQASDKNGGANSIVVEKTGDHLSPSAKFSNAIDAAISHAKGQMGQNDYRNIHKTLSPIEEDGALSPVSLNKNVPPLEGETRQRYSSPRGMRGHSNPNGVIDLTNMASPRSPSTQDGVKGGRGSKGHFFSFDDYMDLAISKLNSKSVDDRYAVEGDESPKKVAVGRKVPRGREGNGVPVVQGVAIRGKNKSSNEVTPRASGGHKRSNSQGNRKKNIQNDSLDDSTQSSFEVYEHPEGQVVMWSEDAAPRNSRHPKSPSRKDKKNKSFAGYLSDGLFDLLSMDESVTRGRNKLPFLSGQPSASDLDSTENGYERTMNGKLDPSLGVMCGAVPLYFMYDQNDHNGKRRRSRRKSRNVEVESDEEEDPDLEVEASSPKKSGARSPKKKGRTPVPSPKNKKSRNIQEDMSERSTDSSSEEKARPGHGILKGGQTYQQNREKALLERDDAYWDTLSTIASTKGRSEDTSKQADGTDADPGPIPEEITMTQDKEQKKKIDEAANRIVQQTIDKKMQNAISELTTLVGEERSTDSLSAKLDALEARKNARDHSTPKATNTSDPASAKNGPDTTVGLGAAVIIGNREDKSVPETTKGIDRSNRSVRWGFEEIYEAAETVGSPTSSGVAAAQPPTAATAHTGDNTPEMQSQTTGSASTGQELSDKEEQELISRTLKLSRQLLASMSAQDFAGASNEVVKSLLSFGTEDSAAKSSLPDANSLQVSNGSTPTPSSVRPLEPTGTSDVTGKSSSEVPFSSDMTMSSFDPPSQVPASFSRAHAAPSSTTSDAKSGRSTNLLSPASSTLDGLHIGTSESSPIDVEELFTRYDNMAHNLMTENAGLKSAAGRSLAVSSDAGFVSASESSSATKFNISSPRGRSGSSRAPANRIEELRAKRAQALAKLSTRAPGNRVPGRQRDRLSGYSQTTRAHSAGRAEPGHGGQFYNGTDNTRVYNPMAANRRSRSAERASQMMDIPEAASFNSDSVNTTASMKARELRRQLDEALQASRSIRNSQEKLGSELQSFKNRFFDQNTRLEDQAIRAMNGLY